MGRELHLVAAIYARQSRGSRTELTSCEVQIDICKSAAAAQGWSLTRPYVDESESSESLDRPAMQELLSEIKARTVTRLVVDRLDRLTRRLVDLLVLLELFADYQVELVVVMGHDNRWLRLRPVQSGGEPFQLLSTDGSLGHHRLLQRVEQKEVGMLRFDDGNLS